MPRIHRFLFPAMAAMIVFGLAGCNLFGSSSRPLVPKPGQLRPEIDTFAQDSVRGYSWSENLRRGKNDSLLGQTNVQVVRTGDTLVGANLLPRLAFHFATGPAHSAAATRLGFDRSRIVVDTANVPDPGPALAFPEFPEIGWRQDTVIGELRFVRELRGVETLRQTGKRHETWAFAESTWWNGERIGTGTSWMGLHGLVRHRAEWSRFHPSGAAAGDPATLWREIRAL